MPTISNTNDLSHLFDRPVIVTQIDAPVQEPDAVVFWHDDTNQGVVIQPLHTAQDRALLARQMEQVRKRMTQP
jgi:hypothetical protein